MDDQQPSPEDSVLWSQQQLRKAQMAMRGLLSRDFGTGNGGEFLEPVQSGQPVPQMYPEDQWLLQAAVSSIDVSADPSVATSLSVDVDAPQDVSSGVSLDEFDAEAGLAYESAPVEDEMPASTGLGSFPQIDPLVNQPASFASQFMAPDAQQIQPGRRAPPEMPTGRVAPIPKASPSSPVQSVEAISAPAPTMGATNPPEPRAIWPPGGRTAAPEPRDQIAESAPVQQPRPRQDQPESRLPPVHTDAAVAPSIPQIDFGMRGDTFGAMPDSTQTAHQDALGVASDAIDTAGEAFLEWIRMLTMMMIRVTDGMEEMKDRLDTEDHSDEF